MSSIQIENENIQSFSNFRIDILGNCLIYFINFYLVLEHVYRVTFIIVLLENWKNSDPNNNWSRE